MARISVTASTETAGSIDVVFALLKDSTSWPRWSPVSSCTMKAFGTSEPHGVGAKRVFSTGLFAVTEEIVEVIPNRRVAYVLKSGLPLKGYRAVTELMEIMGGGTIIIWQASFETTIPLTGWYYKRLIESALKDTVKRLGRTAANRKLASEILRNSHP